MIIESILVQMYYQKGIKRICRFVKKDTVSESSLSSWTPTILSPVTNICYLDIFCKRYQIALLLYYRKNAFKLLWLGSFNE